MSDADGSVGATLVSVDATIVESIEATGVAGADVFSGATTVVFVDAAVVAKAEVLAGATGVDAAELTAGADVLAGATDVAGAEVPDGSDVFAGELDVVEAEVSADVPEVFEVGGEVGATGVLSSASALNGFTTLTVKTNKTAAVKK